jgi:hypothetical protein
MADGKIMWVIGALICVGVFLNGLRFSRMKKSSFKSVSWFSKAIDDPGEMLKKINLIGKIQMIFAPLFLIFWTLILFEVLGPVEGIQTIKLN